MLALQQYSSDENDSDDDNKDNLEDLTAHLKPIDEKSTISSTMQLKAAPDIFTKVIKYIRYLYKSNQIYKISLQK